MSAPSTVWPNWWTKRQWVERAKARSPERRASASSTSSVMPRLRTVSIIPGMLTAAPERTETSSGRSPSPKLRPSACSRPATPARTDCQASSSSSPPAAWKRRHSSIGRHSAGGTGGPGLSIRAMLRPLLPTPSRLGTVAPSRTTTRSATAVIANPPAPIATNPDGRRSPCRSGRSRRLLAFAAQHAEQVLVELEPDRVVAVDAGAADPVGIAGEDPVVGVVEAGLVGAEARFQRGEAVEHLLGPLVLVAEAVDDGGVVVGVGVVVGDPFAAGGGHHLPVGEKGQQLAVDPLEALVGLARLGAGAELGEGLRVALLEPLASGRRDHVGAFGAGGAAGLDGGLEGAGDGILLTAEHGGDGGRAARLLHGQPVQGEQVEVAHRLSLSRVRTNASRRLVASTSAPRGPRRPGPDGRAGACSCDRGASRPGVAHAAAAQWRSSASAVSAGRSKGHQWPHSSTTSSPFIRCARASPNSSGT